MVGTIPEKGSQEGAPEEVIAYFSEDISIAGATFTLMGVKEDVGGELAYYNQVPCDREAPSCYQWHFTPYEPLPTDLYTAEVFGVTDRAGLGMEAPYAWSFEVAEEVGGELLAPPAEAPQAEEGGEPAAAAEPAVVSETVEPAEAAEPAAVPETAEPAAEEEPLEAPAGEGGEIESGMPGVLYVRKTSYYYFGGQRVAMRQTSSWGENVVYYLVTDHLGTTSLVLCGNVSGCDSLADGGTVPNGGRMAESRHYPYGAVRWTWTADGSSTLPTDYRFTGQRDVGLGLTHMGARFLDSALGRWTSADTIIPEPGNPQSLNRFSYCLGNPLRLTDPTGHWSEDELADALGENWQELYFGEGGVFADRKALLAFLLSQDTTNSIILDLVRQFFEFSDLAHGAGVDFANVDALGSRLSFGVGAAGFASLSADVILNLRSGEMSFFGSPEGGFILGGSLSLVGGMTFLREMPSNDSLRGSFMAVGLVGGDVVGADVEAFWSSPMTDQFRAFDRTYGLFLGAGPAVQLGMYGSMGYSFELFRYDVSGDHWFPHVPNVLTVAQEIGWAFAHDVLLHPVWPWSPYR